MGAMGGAMNGRGVQSMAPINGGMNYSRGGSSGGMNGSRQAAPSNDG